MRHGLSIAGAVCALGLLVPANAAEITIVELGPDDFEFGDYAATGLQTYELWLTGLTEGDVLLSLFGDSMSPMTLMTTAVDGFYNADELGQTHFAGNPALFETFPTLQWDTFFAIGDDADASVSPGFPDTALFGGGSSIMENDNLAWFDGDPTTPAMSSGGQIFIGQFSMAMDADFGGMLSAQIRNEAGEEIRYRDLEFFIPAPGALALLGLAGLAGRRRRR